MTFRMTYVIHQPNLTRSLTLVSSAHRPHEISTGNIFPLKEQTALLKIEKLPSIAKLVLLDHISFGYRMNCFHGLSQFVKSDMWTMQNDTFLTRQFWPEVHNANLAIKINNTIVAKMEVH